MSLFKTKYPVNEMLEVFLFDKSQAVIFVGSQI